MDAFQPKLRAGGICREEKEAPGKQVAVHFHQLYL